MKLAPWRATALECLRCSCKVCKLSVSHRHRGQYLYCSISLRRCITDEVKEKSPSDFRCHQISEEARAQPSSSLRLPPSTHLPLSPWIALLFTCNTVRLSPIGFVALPHCCFSLKREWRDLPHFIT